MLDINNKEKLMQAYIDGELSTEQAASLEKELKNNPDLQKQYEENLLLHSLLQNISVCDIEPPADFAACVMQRIEAEEMSTAAVKKAFPWRFAAPAMAAAALLLAFGISGIMPETPFINQPATTVAPENTSVIDEQTTIAATTVIDEPATIIENNTTVTAEITSVITEPATTVAPEDPATTAPEQTAPVIEPTTVPEQENPTIVAPEQGSKPQPENTTAAPENPPVIEPPVTAPEENIPPVSAPDEEIGQGTASMPAPATDTVILGANISVMRFSVEEGDAFDPFRNQSGEIQFYAERGEEVALCTVMDTVAGMEILENSDITLSEESTGGVDYVIKNSPDGTQLAGNMAGDEGGLWISDNNGTAPAQKFSAEGGGNILEWAPNSGKLVFTNAEGSLYVAYVAEGLVLMLCEEPVYSVIWCSDSRGIYFETVDENGRHVICRADLP